jgi:hypothetical protein
VLYFTISSLKTMASARPVQPIIPTQHFAGGSFLVKEGFHGEREAQGILNNRGRKHVPVVRALRPALARWPLLFNPLGMIRIT